MPARSARTSWPGFHYDGRSAERHEVVVHVTPTGLRIQGAGSGDRWWPLAELEQTQGTYPGEPVRFERQGEAVVVDDPSFFVAVRALAPHAGPRRLAGRQGRWRWIPLSLGAAAAIGAVSYLFYTLGIPALADALTTAVPVSWEQGFGDSIVQRAVPPAEHCSPPEARDIDRIVARLAAAEPHGPYRFHVTIARNDQVVNAFAVPGGDIVVFTGLLRKTRSADELAGVLAHEMQHVISRHTTRQLLRQASLDVLISALAHDGGSTAKALSAASAIGALRYRRQDEEEADRLGMARVQAAHLDPQGMVRFFEKLNAMDHGGNASLAFLSDHPLTSDRLRELRRLAQQAHYTPVAALPGVDWRQVSSMCP